MLAQLKAAAAWEARKLVDLPLSPQLQQALGITEGRPAKIELSLRELISFIGDRLGSDGRLLAQVFPAASGTKRLEELLLEIRSFISFDSTVRDVATTGHLGKLLSRKPVFQETHDWRIFGLPHTLFDKLSWAERNQLFREGVTHAFDPELLGFPIIREMLEREATIIGRSF
jgi:hypothetical protein